MPKTPIVGVKYEDLQMYYQCRIIGCSTKCQASPKESGRLSVHWKKKHVDDHGSFNGREVLVKTRNEDGTFSSTTFGAYADANGLKYKTQDSPRPNRHTNKAASSSSSTKAKDAPMGIHSSPFALPTVTISNAIAQPTSNLRGVARMERELRIASTPDRLLQEESSIRDTLDSHPDLPLGENLPQLSASTRHPQKSGLMQGFPKPKSKPTQAQSYVAYDFPLSVSPPLPRTALNATEALRGSLNLPAHISDGLKKDYSHSTWSCEMCHKDFPDLQSVTVHLRDHHYVQEDVVTLTPDRDVITMVLASVKVDDEEHGWVDESGEAIRSEVESDGDETETDEEMQGE